MEDNKQPVDFLLLSTAIGNVLNDLVYYQLREIKQTRPLSDEGEEAFKKMDEIMCFQKVDMDLKLLSSLQESIDKYLEERPSEN